MHLPTICSHILSYTQHNKIVKAAVAKLEFIEYDITVVLYNNYTALLQAAVAKS